MKNRKTVRNGIVKVPVVIQMETPECGAACLTMVLAYYRKWVPLVQIRSDCGVSRDGSNAKNIIKAAGLYGLEAKGYCYEPADLRDEGTFPCIIHWNFNHFVVLRGFIGNRAYITDPAKGAYSVSEKEFDSSFTGVCIFFSPQDDFKPSGKKKSILKFALQKMSGNGAAFTLITLTTVIISIIGILLPGLSRAFVDKILTNPNNGLMAPFIFVVSVIVFLQIITQYIKTVYSYKAKGKIEIVANSEYMWHVLHLPMEFFSQRLAGDVSNRKSKNAEVIDKFIQIFAPLTIECAMVIFYLVVMMRYNTWLTLAGVISVGLNIFLSHIISQKRVDLTRVISRDNGNLIGATVSGIEMIETIKSNGAETGFFEKWSGHRAAVNKGEVALAELNTYLGLIPQIIRIITNTFIFMGSVYLCMRGAWTVGMISAFAGLLTSFLTPAAEILSASQDFQEVRTDMERIDDIMEYPAENDAETFGQTEDKKYTKLSGRLELKNVTFGYAGSEEPLIKDLSISVKPGQRVAIVGSSGSGKSTTAKLISGLYKPWSGEILFDGRSISDTDRNVFKGSLAVVDQDITLFEDTIENNIKMWDRSIEDFEMILAAHDAQIDQCILQRDSDYGYKLSSGGRDMSGGERQRLEIARALAGDPTIIILDEATSALDAKTESNVVKAIRDRGITCIVIAHRLSTIRDCDEIIVLDRGTAVERGTHEELLKKGGLYTRLITNE